MNIGGSRGAFGYMPLTGGATNFAHSAAELARSGDAFENAVQPMPFLSLSKGSRSACDGHGHVSKEMVSRNIEDVCEQSQVFAEHSSK